MKKAFVSLLIAGVLVLAVNPAVKAAGSTDNVLRVGASPTPHAEMLNLIKDDLWEQGVVLKVIEFTDYILPNNALISGDLDANFFQHAPYLESTNTEWTEKLTPAFGVHIEPFGLYSVKHKNLVNLPNGASIAIPNDPTNEGRALLLLQTVGLIKLRDGVGWTATPRDIVNNPKNFRFQELEAAQLPRSLQDVDAATINGNYAIGAGFSLEQDALLIEGTDSPYVNIVAVQKGRENDPKIIALKNALFTRKIKDYISKKYKGGVLAVF